jgi:tetratricopeptide (TPR) repeat protein
MTAAKLMACVCMVLSAGCGTLRPPRLPPQPTVRSVDGVFSSALAHYATGLLLETAVGRTSAEAGDAYLQAHRLDPASDPPFSLATLRLLEGGRTNEALALVRAQVRRQPESTEVWITLAQLAETSGDFARAAGAYARVRALRGNAEAAAGATLGEVRNRFKADQDRTAVRLLRQQATVTNLPPILLQVPLQWARHFILSPPPAPARALPLIQIMIDTASDPEEKAIAQTFYGDALIRSGFTNRAIRAYWSALDTDPACNPAARRIGETFHALADTTGVSRLTARIASSPQPLREALVASYAWTMLGQPEAAAAALLAGRDAARRAGIQPSSTYSLTLGAALDDLDHDDQAADVFCEALSVHTNAHAIMNHLAYMWAVNGERLDEALEWVTRALTHEPRIYAYIDTLGWVYYRLGRLNDALTQLLIAARLAPEEDGVILDHIGDTLHALHRNEEAVAFWRRAATLIPDLAGLRDKIERVSSAATSDRP